MKLSELKNHLNTATSVSFTLPDGSFVPEHFHVTEVGLVTKNFIDCGGTVRAEKVISLQLWNANDTDHRLKPQKLQKIIALSEKVLEMEDLEIEVEYQTGTIGKYGLDFNGQNFVLSQKRTDCLAKNDCGTSQNKHKLILSELQSEASCCTPEGGCC